MRAPRSRRGEGVGTITKFAIALLILAIIGIGVIRANKAGGVVLYCPKDGDTVSCKSVNFCKDIGLEDATSVLGCSAGQRCCRIATDSGGGGPNPTVVSTIPPATISLRSGASTVPLNDGQTIVTVPNTPKQFTVTGTVTRQNTITWGSSVSLTDDKGVVVTGAGITVNGNTKTTAELAEDIASSITTATNAVKDGEKAAFSLPQIDVTYDETSIGKFVLLAISIWPKEKGQPDTIEKALVAMPDKVQQYKLYFNVKPALRYAGLTQQWTKSKTITAGCEQIKCDGLYFKFVPEGKLTGTDPNRICPVVPAGDAVNAPNLGSMTRYCPYPKGTSDVCAQTKSECERLAFAKSNPAYTSAWQAWQTAIKSGIVDDQEWTRIVMQFSGAQSRLSSKECRIDLKEDASTGDKLYRADTFDPNQGNGRGTFVLDRPSMQNMYLCVYGKEAGVNDGNLKSAGPAQRIKIDAVPPIATVTFQPWTLTLSFACEDQLPPGAPAGLTVNSENYYDYVSGCKGTYGLAYISNLASFFSALGKGGQQNAAAWCPAYQTGGGYSQTSKSQVVYQENAVRLLCVRAEDNAGNAGVSMVTVYNSYDLIAAAIAEAQD